jgi:sugar lactone lactonase YvrE
MSEVQCVLDAGAELGEGTFWDSIEQVLWWVDIWGRVIHRFDPATGSDDSFATPSDIGSLAPRTKGGLVVAMAEGFHFFDPATGRFTPIVAPEDDKPHIRFNDGKTDRQGRFWSGTMFEAPGLEFQPVGTLYRLDTDLRCTAMLAGIGCSNGLAFSPDSRTMYFADSPARTAWAFDFDPATGGIANRRVFIDFRDTGGVPDGATVDAEGCYWITLPETGKVCRYDPDGKLMRTILLPTSIPTCCEFGGPSLDILYVTSARLRKLTDRLAGALFAIEAGVRGLTLPPFAG